MRPLASTSQVPVGSNPGHRTSSVLIRSNHSRSVRPNRLPHFTSLMASSGRGPSPNGGFADDLRQAAASRSDVVLVDAARLYSD